MDKKTKLLLGVGVVGVGAYLLFKSKKATTPALTSAVEPAKFVGADSFASVGERMISADSTKFASVGERMISADSTKFASVGARQIAMSGGMINSSDVVGARAGSQNSGIFANQPFTGDVANMVGASGEKVFANQSGRFFDPRTARYGQNQGVFAPRMPKKPMPRRTLPVEPDMPVPVTQPTPLNNLVGQDGSRFFSVHDGFGK
jgi:hypothetical protein